jgi:thiamine biosynthesis lipoprotein
MTTTGTRLPADVTHAFRCMAVDVNVRLIGSPSAAQSAAAAVEEVFRRVEKACTRFNPESPLMLANAAAESWHAVPAECFVALIEAAKAHAATRGRFDPRVLSELVALGYDRSLPFGVGPVDLGMRLQDVVGRILTIRPPWHPEFDPAASAVRIGPVPVDLGGIGKGLAVRWAADALRGRVESFLIEAGGDVFTVGSGPEGEGWRAAVEDPRGGDQPLAVLDVMDRACATSSIRVRSWRVNGRLVHHLLDPLTGRPGGEGLLSVTVLGPDPAWAEVHSKTLFLAGRNGIAEMAADEGHPALWVDVDGGVHTSSALHGALLWQAPDGC